MSAATDRQRPRRRGHAPLGTFVELPPTPPRGEPHWQAYPLAINRSARRTSWRSTTQRPRAAPGREHRRAERPRPLRYDRPRLGRLRRGTRGGRESGQAKAAACLLAADHLAAGVDYEPASDCAGAVRSYPRQETNRDDDRRAAVAERARQPAGWLRRISRGRYAERRRATVLGGGLAIVLRRCGAPRRIFELRRLQRGGRQRNGRGGAIIPQELLDTSVGPTSARSAATAIWRGRTGSN